MTQQWMRWISLDVGTSPSGFSLASTESLRVSFSIERDEKSWPNTAQIDVYNLNPDHRKYLSDLEGVPVRLHAGYESGTGLLFDGMLRDVDFTDGIDRVTTLSLGDGEMDKDGEPIAGKAIKATWSRGTPIVTILQAFAQHLNVNLGNTSTMGAAAKLPTGVALSHAFAVDGPALDEFIYFMRSLQMPWSIQNGSLQVRAAPEVPASMGALISPQTGLIGHVKAKTKLVKRFKKTQKIKVAEGKCLLLPVLLPGQQFVLKSSTVSGPVMCTKVHHSGDTHGNEWYTEFEGIYG